LRFDLTTRRELWHLIARETIEMWNASWLRAELDDDVLELLKGVDMVDLVRERRLTYGSR
jgi:hypothetical protein